MPVREFTVEDAKHFYDRFGAKQDLQFYENRALDRLLASADFEHASSVFELGCGTGRLAERLLGARLPAQARYVGADVSKTMVRLARERLAPWPERATVRLSDGSTSLADADGTYDRFIATYVLDLLPDESVRHAVREAHRVLSANGLLCLVSMTEGTTLLSRALCSAWKGLYALSPRLVGGCKPMQLKQQLEVDAWHVEHVEVVSAWGVCSEVLVARPV